MVHGLSEDFWCPEIVACGESVASVEAHAYTGFVLNESDDVPKIFEGAAQNIATGCHVLQQCDDYAGLAVRLVDVAGQMRYSLLSVATLIVAWMEVVQCDA